MMFLYNRRAGQECSTRTWRTEILLKDEGLMSNYGDLPSVWMRERRESLGTADDYPRCE